MSRGLVSFDQVSQRVILIEGLRNPGGSRVGLGVLVIFLGLVQLRFRDRRPAGINHSHLFIQSWVLGS